MRAQGDKRTCRTTELDSASQPGHSTENGNLSEDDEDYDEEKDRAVMQDDW